MYRTRPAPRRVIGVLAAGVVVATVNLLVDVVAYIKEWWRYPYGLGAVPYGPPLFYVSTGLWYGVGVALIGGRLTRRFGRRGLLAVPLFMGIYGPLRDELGAGVTGLIVYMDLDRCRCLLTRRVGSR